MATITDKDKSAIRTTHLIMTITKDIATPTPNGKTKIVSIENIVKMVINIPTITLTTTADKISKTRTTTKEN